MAVMAALGLQEIADAFCFGSFAAGPDESVGIGVGQRVSDGALDETHRAGGRAMTMHPDEVDLAGRWHLKLFRWTIDFQENP